MFNFPNVYNGTVATVYGKEGAESFKAQFPMAPNSNIVLIDATTDRIWWLFADGTGFKILVPYLIELEQEVPKESLEDRVAKLEGLLNESDVTSNEQNGASSTDDESGAVSE